MKQRSRALRHYLPLTVLAGSLLLPFTASAQEAVELDLPGSRLDQALNALARQSSVQIIFASDIAAGRRVPALKGRFTPQQALNRLLDHSGLASRAENERTFVIVAAAPSAAVQPVPAPRAVELENVMISGEKIQRTEQETLSSVAVTTSNDMREHNDANLLDILARTPGVYTQSGNENWGIRGVPVSGFDDQGPAAMNGAVSVYVDDALQTNRSLTFNPMSMWDMEQVEVYRGAQSTTQGRNSLAGAIIMRSKDPTFDPHFAVQGNVGKYGEQGTSAMANGALIDGLLAGRLAVDYQTSDGYGRNETLNSNDNQLRSANIRGKLLFTPSNDLDVLLTFDHSAQRLGINSTAAVDGHPRYFKLFENTETRDGLQQNTATAKVNYRLDDSWSLTSITSGTWMNVDSQLDFDSTPTANQIALRNNKQKLANQEIRANYDSDRVKGVMGVYLGHSTGKIDDELALGTEPLLQEKGDITINSQALFGELNWEFVDRWKLITGLRYDHEKNTTKIEYPLDLLGLATDPSANVSNTSSVFLPKLGISYDLSENQTLGLTWQRGYRSGGVNIRTAAQHNAYDPEYTSTYELAYRGTFLDQRLRTSANLYHTNWKDQQATFLDANDNRQVANAAKSRLIGLELAADYLLTSQLRLTAGASWNDTKYESFVTDGIDYSGEDFLFAPKYTASVGANYTFGNKLMLGSDVTYQSGSNSAFVTNDDSQVIGKRRSDDVVLVNLNAEYPLTRSVTLKGYVHNLFDERYITNNQAADLLDVGAPLTVGMAARYDF